MSGLQDTSWVICYAVGTVVHRYFVLWHICDCFFNHSRYHKAVSLEKGKMEVLTDQETKNMIWERGDTMFYKKGVTDPDYCVLKFSATSGRYYCDLN